MLPAAKPTQKIFLSNAKKEDGERGTLRPEKELD